MKKNNSMRIAIVVIALTLITSCFVGSTFARYTASIETGDTARVAQFAVSAFGETLDAVEDTVTFDLFQKSNIYDTVDADYANGNDEKDIAEAATANDPAIIAPGTWGKFNFNVDNNSEVAVTYAIAYTYAESNDATDGGVKDVPLQWTLTPNDENSWKSDITQLNVAAAEATYDGEGNLLSQGTELEVGAAEVPVTVYWRWAIGDDRNAADTALGFAGTLTPSITVKVTFTQVD